jgi:hypothetical protein
MEIEDWSKMIPAERDVAGYLDKLGMFPRMTLKEAKQLVNSDSKNSKSGNLETCGGNCYCNIAGQTTYTYMLDLNRIFLNNLLEFIRFYGPYEYNYRYYKGKIGGISFGEFWDGYPIWNPSVGWVHTDGFNGIIDWEGEFYGARGGRQFAGEIYEYLTWVFMGVTNFNGLWIDKRGEPPCYLGYADHVNLRYERPPNPS